MALHISTAGREALLQARNSIDAALAAIEAEYPALPPVAVPGMNLPAPVVEHVAKTGGLRDPASLAKFFEGVRGKLWPKMTTSQVAGCVAILTACAGVFPISWTAYALATAYHETGYTMQPIREKGNGDRDGDGWDDYFEKYDTGRLAAALGNTPEADGDGAILHGRGLVQITGTTNYKRATKRLRELGILTQAEDLMRTPDLALRPDVSSAIMVYGMKEGWFTGKSLRDYLPARATLANFTSARRIINGVDKAAAIAGYAVSFQNALIAAGWE